MHHRLSFFQHIENDAHDPEQQHEADDVDAAALRAEAFILERLLQLRVDRVDVRLHVVDLLVEVVEHHVLHLHLLVDRERYLPDLSSL